MIVGDRGVAAFSRKSGISESAIRKYLKEGTQPSLDNLITIASTAGVSIDWLALGGTHGRLLKHVGAEGPEGDERFIIPATPSSVGDDYARQIEAESATVPVLSVKLAPDGPMSGEVVITCESSLPRDWLLTADVTPETSFLVEVQGDAMSPMLEEGDLVLGELEDRVERGVYAASLDGYLRVAHFFRRGDVIVMKDEYEEREVQDDPSFRLIGRVRRRLTGLRS